MRRGISDNGLKRIAQMSPDTVDSGGALSSMVSQYAERDFASREMYKKVDSLDEEKQSLMEEAMDLEWGNDQTMEEIVALAKDTWGETWVPNLGDAFESAGVHRDEFIRFLTDDDDDPYA